MEIGEDLNVTDLSGCLNLPRQEKYSRGNTLIDIDSKRPSNVEVLVELADVDMYRLNMPGHISAVVAFLETSRQGSAVTAPVRFEFHH